MAKSLIQPRSRSLSETVIIGLKQMKSGLYKLIVFALLILGASSEVLAANGFYVVDGYNHYCKTIKGIDKDETAYFKYIKNNDPYDRHFMIGINCPEANGQRMFTTGGCQGCAGGRVCNIGTGGGGVYAYRFEEAIPGDSVVCTWPTSDHEPGLQCPYKWIVEDSGDAAFGQPAFPDYPVMDGERESIQNIGSGLEQIKTKLNALIIEVRTFLFGDSLMILPKKSAGG